MMATVDEYVIMNIEAESKADLDREEAGDNVRFAVRIPHGTTEIEEDAFHSSKKVVSVELPGTIKSIGDRAFYGCSNLTAITIPPSVTAIGNVAFNHCRSLTTITIPPSVTWIGYHAFGNCTNLISAAIPDSVVSVQRNAFNDCENLQYVAAPAHIVNNPGGMFTNCPKLDNGQKGIVLTTPATRLQVLRLQYFHPSTMSCLFRPEQRDFLINLMMIGDRINSVANSLFPSIPREVMVLILQQLRVHDLGPC